MQASHHPLTNLTSMESILNAILASSRAVTQKYPPYDFEIVEENKFKLTLAVAGFNKDEIAVDVAEGVLTITGSRPPEPDSATPRNFVHKGIATRPFKMELKLHDYVKVVGAAMANGLLDISMERIIPDELKPRTITIV